MSEHDPLARRYRELAREEPPAALDAAILAASRRAVARPSAARRWAAPISIAAVLVLAFGLTLEMQQDRRADPVPVESPASPPASPAPPPSPAQVAPPQAAEPRSMRSDTSVAKPMRAPAPKALQKEEKPAQLRDAAPAVPPPAAAPAERFAPAPLPAPPQSALPAGTRTDPAAAAEGAAANRTESFDRAKAKSLAAPGPEDELERIAKLRAQGRHEEADKALEEFRGRHPGYRIPDAIWEQVRPR